MGCWGGVGWGVHSHYVVKPNLVLRLGWGFDKNFRIAEIIGQHHSIWSLPIVNVLTIFCGNSKQFHNLYVWVISLHLCENFELISTKIL